MNPPAGTAPRINSKLIEAMVTEALISKSDKEAAVVYAKRDSRIGK